MGTQKAICAFDESDMNGIPQINGPLSSLSLQNAAAPLSKVHAFPTRKQFCVKVMLRVELMFPILSILEPINGYFNVSKSMFCEYAIMKPVTYATPAVKMRNSNLKQEILYDESR